MQIELTHDEAQQLVGLLDLAVKAGGLQTAVVAVTLFEKIKKAAETE